MNDRALKRNRQAALLCAGSILTVMSSPALAQLDASVPAAQVGPADPGRIENRLGAQTLPPRDVAPNLEVQQAPTEAAPAGAENVTFRLDNVIFENASVYTRDELRELYADRRGATISLADLYAIAASATRKYRNDGYILTQVIVPPQTIEDGDVRLRVIEGFVDHIIVEGDTANNDIIEGYAAQISEGGPMKISDMERALLLINDLPGITARGILSPSPDKVGAAEMRILVERKPYDAELFANNFGTRYLGPVQLGASGALNSPFGQHERITAQAIYAPDKIEPELMYGSLGYLQPVGDYGTTLQLLGSYTDTEPGFNLEQFDVDGRAKFVSLTAAHPIIRSRRVNLTGRLGVDMRNVDSESDVDFTRKDRLRAARLGGRFEYLSTWLMPAYNMLDAEISRGLDVFGSSDSSDLDVSRPGADESFTKIEAEIQRLQRVSDQFNMLVGAYGQWSNDSLFSSEEFGVGGLRYGRGYDSSEITGDDGVAAKVEVQWETPLELRYVASWQPYAFYDVGKVWNDDATTSSQEKQSLASTGIGVRAALTTATSVDAFMAVPLTRQPQTENSNEARFYLGLSQRF